MANKPVVELHFMPIKRKWRILIDGKAFPRRFSDRASAMKEFKRQKAKAEVSNGILCNR